jgi:signal transduction histidine kinase
MLDSPLRSISDLNPLARFIDRLPELTTFRRQLRLLQWLIPAGLVLLVVAYELGPSRWTYESLGFTYHLLVEIVVFGTVGPLLAFVLLDLLGRWIEDRETADLQARLLSVAGEKEHEVRELSDDTLQVLFATNLLVTQLKGHEAGLPPGTMEQLEVTGRALNESMEKLRGQLLS